MRGRFIAFEGGEASGKSTQAERLATRLGALLTREPGGTPLGARIRELLLDPEFDAIDSRAEALLMAADRAQHVAEVVLPVLERGDDVITDRYIGSSLAYQGFGRGLALDEIGRMSRWATGGLSPDIVVLLDVPSSVARQRRDGGPGPDRLEAEDDRFHERVRDGYRVLAGQNPDRWLVVDGVGDVDDVEARVWSAVTTRMT